MLQKANYMPVDGEIQRVTFNGDIQKFAHQSGISVPMALREFFASDTFTKKEMRSFALHISRDHELVESAVALLYALDINSEKAPEANILVEYFGVSESDPLYQSYSWVIDNAMNWPQGTVMPASRQFLGR